MPAPTPHRKDYAHTRSVFIVGTRGYPHMLMFHPHPQHPAHFMLFDTRTRPVPAKCKAVPAYGTRKV